MYNIRILSQNLSSLDIFCITVFVSHDE